MLKLGVDVDGCLANFTDSYAALLTRRSGIPFPPSSDEWPTCWFWDRAAGITKDIETETWSKDILQSINFWKNLEPLPNAKPAIRWLNRLARTNNEVYFITNRPGHSSKYQTEKWLYALGMNYPTVITTADKLAFVKAIKLDFYIDDKPETIQEIAAANIPGLRLYLRQWAYNRDKDYPANVWMCKDVLSALQESYGN
jgi:hypothetical protein